MKYPALLLALLTVAAVAAEGQDAGLPWRDPWLGRDKLAHAALSLALVGYGYHLARYEAGNGSGGARRLAVGVTLSLGLLKELADRGRPGNRFSCQDLAADLAGTAVGTALFTIKK